MKTDRFFAINSFYGRIRSFHLYYFVICLLSFLGIASMIMNYRLVMEQLSNSFIKYVLALLGNFVNSLLSVNFYLMILSLTTYFAAAAMQKGFDIRVFGRMSMKALSFLPLTGVSDILGLIVFGKKLIAFGAIGLISYIPFYFSVFFLIFLLLPDYLEVTKKEDYIISALGTIAIIIASYPYS